MVVLFGGRAFIRSASVTAGLKVECASPLLLPESVQKSHNHIPEILSAFEGIGRGGISRGRRLCGVPFLRRWNGFLDWIARRVHFLLN